MPLCQGQRSNGENNMPMHRFRSWCVYMQQVAVVFVSITNTLWAPTWYNIAQNLENANCRSTVHLHYMYILHSYIWHKNYFLLVFVCLCAFCLSVCLSFSMISQKVIHVFTQSFRHFWTSTSLWDFWGN